jgi:hypothetical protein
MFGVCPVAGYAVNEKVSRLNAGITFVILLVFLFSQAKWVICVLLADLGLRSFGGFGYSPFNIISTSLLELTKAPPVMVEAGPKLFTTRCGFVLCLLVCILLLLKIIWLATLLVLLLLVLVALEFIWGFCIGCRVYAFLRR